MKFKVGDIVTVIDRVYEPYEDWVNIEIGEEVKIVNAFDDCESYLRAYEVAVLDEGYLRSSTYAVYESSLGDPENTEDRATLNENITILTKQALKEIKELEAEVKYLDDLRERVK